MSVHDLQVERRNGFGTRGRPVNVVTNTFKVSRQPDFMIQQYDVSFSDDRCKEKRLIMRYLLEKEEIFQKASIGAVYDGQSILYLPGPVALEERTFEVSESEARGRPSRPDRPAPKNLKIKITPALSINMAQLAKLVEGRAGLDDGETLQAVNALNVAIKYAPSGVFPSRRATFYVPPMDDRQRRLLGGGLEAWGGFFLSIRPAIGKMVMNFDRASGAFKQSGRAVDVLLTYMQWRDPRDLEPARMAPKLRVRMKRFLKNLSVKLVFSRDPNAKYKIRGVSDESAANYLFETEPGRQMNVAQYISQKYNYQIRFPWLPCVQLTKIAWYPLECVEILPGTQFLGKLEPDQVAEMIKFTTMKPNERLNTLRDGLKHLRLAGDSMTLRHWNFDVEQRPITVPARILDPPPLTFADGRTGGPAVIMPRDGAWDKEMRGKKALKSPTIVQRWFVVVFADDSPGREGFARRQVEVSVNQFVGACKDFGITFTLTEPMIVHVGSTPDVKAAIKDVAKRAGYGKNAPPQFVLAYIQTKSSPEYALIKAACDVTFGVASQCLVIQQVARQKGNQYYANVALKVNVKLEGGVNQRVEGWLPGFKVTTTIVFGADVGHPGPGSLLPSIAGVVASCDPHGVKYGTAVRAQNGREEIIMDLEAMAYELIDNYRKVTGKLPDRVIFYRDGVSEGQFDQVARHEIAALKKCYARFLRVQPGYAPKTSFIICGKRHHYKFFPIAPQDGDRSGNVRAGTVIDSDITHPYYNDFYLMSHAGLLGTSKPTHYTTILDESKLGPDQLQVITYQLAYIYARSTRSVSIASPAYYAHHVCFRARHHIGDDDGSTDAGSMSSDQEDRFRNQKLEYAQNKLTGMNGVNPALHNTLYFM